jgi:hypothetical protein
MKVHRQRQKKVVRLCDYEPQQIEWLLPGRLAAGKVTLADGPTKCRNDPA